MKSLVVGGAGFIGSHLVDRLVARGPVRVLDDLSVGRPDHLAAHLASGACELVVTDVRDVDATSRAAEGADVIFHLSANPEARWGLEDTRLDLEQGTVAAWSALEAARRARVPRFVFSSSGTVYGELERHAAEGDLGSLPISLYGASKLAGEALASAFSHCFGLQALVVRFGNVVGPRGTHGAALDFLKKLRATDPDDPELEVLGDGAQSKPYLWVGDCADGLLFVLDHAPGALEVFNLAPSDATSVRTIAEACVAASPYPRARIRYTGGERGWKGDVPRSRMSPDRLAALGFRVRHTSDDAVRMAVEALAREVFGPHAA